MNIPESIRRQILFVTASLTLSTIALGQADSVKDETITSPLHQTNAIRSQVDEQQIDIHAIKPAGGWELSPRVYDKDKIRDLKRQIAQKLFEDITSVVVINDGKLLIEEYFNGATRDVLHDTRSVGKSFASALAGIAVRDGHVRSENQALGEFYELKKFANYSSKKKAVTLKSLLTMTSGFVGDDFQEESPGNEEKMYPTPDWVKFALDLPMDAKKETEKDWNYFTAGVVVLGDILHRAAPGGLEKYAHKQLFEPLGINEYEWRYTPQKVVSTAGGLRMKSLDLARFGLLYKNGGAWDGKQILPRRWVESSLSNQIKLPGRESEYYGYLFWNKVYNVDGKQHEVFYASGNGGNKIFVFKDRPLVVVVTATAYNKPYGHPQVDRMMEKFILPAVL